MSKPFYAKGRYVCVVTDNVLGESKTKKTPQVTIQFKVISFEDGGEVPAQYVREAQLYLTDKAAPRTGEVLKHLGYQKDSFRYLDKSQPGYRDLSGQQFVGFCIHEGNDNGDTFEKWGISIGDGGRQLESKPMESRKLREIDNLFGKALKDGATKAPAPAPVPAGGIDDGDVPF